MEKQYSVKFFASFLEALQKVCRDFVDFDDSIELSGYLSLEIDNVKKERYVLSEMLNSSGNVISESYCTKAFKTVRKYQQQSSGRENVAPRSQTISNRSHAFMSESQSQNSSSPMFNYKDHMSETRMSKSWGQDVYGTNSHGSGQHYADGVGVRGMKTSTPKRSISTIVIDDPPSNKRGRSESLPDDKLLSETSSQQQVTCKLDTEAMQAEFSNSSQAQSMSHLPTTSSSLQHQDNNSITSHTSTSQPNSESIRLPLPVTIKDEPEVPSVDIDLSELDSADSMGGSDSGSGYPSAEAMSGQYRMAGSSQGTHDQSYQSGGRQTFRRKGRQYSPVAMENAYLAVQEGKMTVSAAARKFGVPQPTLHARFKFGRGPGVLRRGRRPGCIMGSSFYKGLPTMVQDEVPNLDSFDVSNSQIEMCYDRPHANDMSGSHMDASFDRDTSFARNTSFDRDASFDRNTSFDGPTGNAVPKSKVDTSFDRSSGTAVAESRVDVPVNRSGGNTMSDSQIDITFDRSRGNGIFGSQLDASSFDRSSIKVDASSANDMPSKAGGSLGKSSENVSHNSQTGTSSFDRSNGNTMSNSQVNSSFDRASGNAIFNNQVDTFDTPSEDTDIKFHELVKELLPSSPE